MRVLRVLEEYEAGVAVARQKFGFGSFGDAACRGPIHRNRGISLGVGYCFSIDIRTDWREPTAQIFCYSGAREVIGCLYPKVPAFHRFETSWGLGMGVEMSKFKKGLAIGLGAGVALTMALLDIWGRQLRREIYTLAQPAVLRPLSSVLERSAASASHLPSPWTPEATGTAHESWKIRTLDGNPVRLADFKGRVLFLDLWSTTCVPCIAQMPSIERLRDSLPAAQVTFLAVTTDEEQQVRKFLKEVHVSLPVYLAQSPPPPALQTSGWPTVFVFNRNGAAIFREVGGANWDDDAARGFLLSLADH